MRNLIINNQSQRARSAMGDGSVPIVGFLSASGRGSAPVAFFERSLGGGGWEME